MFKLMIADDNPYALRELRDIVDWEEFDLTLIGAFPNGKDLLSAAQEEMPDVVITDISMPILNGIALTNALRELCPEVKIIFLSNYSDFEYVQKAIHLHITDYLLKPFDPAQLTAVMKNVVHELCDERLQRFKKVQHLRQAEFYRTQAIENYMERLLYQPEDASQIRERLTQLDYSVSDSILMRIAHVVLSDSINNIYAEYSNMIRSVLQIRQNSNYDLILLSHNAGAFSVLILYSDPGFDVDNLLSQLHIDIETTIGVHATIGFSSADNDFSKLSELNAQAVIAATQKTKNVVIGYDDVQTDSPRLSKKHSPANITDYVKKMKEFIHANYMMPITTSDVSSAVFLSSSYANQCFSAEYNCTIFDYITQCRIEKAKVLLTQTNTKVSSVAELVGYNGKTSFYLAFKRNVGVSPTEYRCIHNSLEG